jgi:hypothetical protein
MNRDPFVLVPNAIGVSLGLALAALKVLFWKRAPQGAEKGAAAVGEVVLDAPDAEAKPAAAGAAKPDTAADAV